MEPRNAADYCSMLDRHMLIFGLSGPAECALGTGQHVLGISQDRLVLKGLFGFEIQVGMGTKEVSIQREQEKRPLSLTLKFNRHNAFLGLKFKW
jgi:hypothetical protein